jgi:hypothetical protein
LIICSANDLTSPDWARSFANSLDCISKVLALATFLAKARPQQVLSAGAKAAVPATKVAAAIATSILIGKPHGVMSVEPQRTGAASVPCPLLGRALRRGGEPMQNAFS